MKLKLSFFITLGFCFLFGCLHLQAQAVKEDPKEMREFTPDFKETYSGRKYNYEGKPVRSHSKAQRGNSTIYSDKKPYLKEASVDDDVSFNMNGINGLLLLILLLAVAYLAYTLLNDGSSKLFGTRQYKKLKPDVRITVDTMEQTDIQSLITSAENNQEYRLAIRYYYLLVLKKLAFKKLIAYEEDTTNAEYIQAVKNQPFSQEFSYTSYLYNYTWYGEFNVDATQYQSVKRRFMQLLKKVDA